MIVENDLGNDLLDPPAENDIVDTGFDEDPKVEDGSSPDHEGQFEENDTVEYDTV